MNPDSLRLIDLATAPLKTNAELELAARAELRKQLDSHHATPEAIQKAADALDHADQHPRRRYWKTALYLATLSISTAILAPSVWKLRALSQISNFIGPLFSHGPASEPDTTAYSPNEKLLLYGDPDAVDLADRWKPLWDSEPDNPAYLAQYAAAYFRDHDKLSPKILEAAERIDPDNGWFLALAAAGPADNAIEKIKPPGVRTNDEIKTPAWTILNRQELDETLSLLHQSMEKPRFNSYEKDLIQQRIPLLPKRHDWLSQLPPVAYLASQTTSVIHLRKLADVLSAEARECGLRNDSEGFRQIVSDWEKLVEKSTRNGLTLVDLLLAKVTYFGPAESFRDAARTLGLEQQATRFATIHEQKEDDKKFRNRRGHSSETDDLVHQKGSLFAALTVPIVGRQVKSPPLLSSAGLTPGRYADHAFLARVTTPMAWAILGISAGLAFLHRFRQAVLFRDLSVRTEDLLRPADWIMILAGGIFIPIIWYVIITRLTPLSAREWSFGASGFIQPFCQFGSMLLMIIVLPPVIAAWRLGRRGKAIGLTTGHQWLGWLACIATAVATPVSGAMLLWHGNLLFHLTFILLGFAALWILVGFIRNIFSKHPQALRRATLARAVIPPWIFGMLMLTITVPFHHVEERRWIQQDRLFKITAEAPALSRYEWDITRILRAEILEMMASAASTE